MVQPGMFGLKGIVDLGRLPGASQAHKLQLLGDAVYAAKCFRSDRPYTLVNEAVSAELAAEVMLPIPARRQIEYDGKLWFGMEWRPEQRNLTEGTLRRLTNFTELPAMLAFDVFVCNPDRHGANIVVQKISPTLERYAFWLINHSHALVGTRRSVAQFLQEPKETRNYLRHSRVLLGSVRSMSDFDSILARIEALSDQRITKIVNSIPEEWKHQPDDTSLLIDFLCRRRQELRALLQAAQDVFPNIR